MITINTSSSGVSDDCDCNVDRCDEEDEEEDDEDEVEAVGINVASHNSRLMTGNN